MNYYKETKNKLIDNEVYTKIKDYSKERHTVITYFEIGKLLYEAGNKYGENIIKNYSKKLMLEVGKKYSTRTLRSMRQLYVFFKDQNWKPVVANLNWSHYLQLLPLKEIDKINYYINECIIHKLSKRELIEKIKSKEYERLSEETKLNKNIELEKID